MPILGERRPADGGVPRCQRTVALVVLTADAMLIAGLAWQGSVVTYPGGWGYLIAALAAVVAYAAAAVAVTGRNRPWVLSARSVGLRFGVLTGGMWALSLTVETFAGLHGWPNLVATAPLLLGGFVLWGVAAAISRRRTGSIPGGVLAAVCAAMVCVVLTITVGFTFAYLALTTLEHNIDGSPEYLQSHWEDLHAFAIANTLDAAFTHAMIAPIVAVVTGSIDALLARHQPQPLGHQPSRGLGGVLVSRRSPGR